MDLYEIEIEQLSGHWHRWFASFNGTRFKDGYTEGFPMAVEAAQHAIDDHVGKFAATEYARP